MYLKLAAGWLIATNLGHTWGYYGAFVTRELLQDSRRAAYELMKEPADATLMNASFWTVLQMLALELTFFLAFAAAVTLWVARMGSPRREAQYAAICTVTFGLGAIAFLFVHPQINAAVIALGATLLFGLAWQRASRQRKAL